MKESNQITRREMLAQTGKAAAGVGLGLTLGSRMAWAQDGARVKGANDRLVIALIGSGGMGRGDMDGFMGHPNVEVAAVCDPDTGHMAEAAAQVEKKQGRRPREIKDFRKVLEDKDIDAVIVATPDHWHALPMIYACQAGKDVFCEKPISHNIREGRMMVNAARHYNRICQINTWQRSTQHFVDAIDYVRSGKLGTIAVVRAFKTDNYFMGRQQPKDPPTELDYDLWVGPAAFVPYQENRCHFNWRWFFDFAAGMTGDWGVHMIDIALLGMAKDDNLPLPQSASAVGGKLIHPDDDRTTPETQLAVFQFPGWVLHWETHTGDIGLDGGGDHGAEFIGTNGRLMVDRNGWRVTDKDGKELEKPSSPRRVDDHIGNFLDAVRTRMTPRADVASLHQTTTVCHLANLAYLAGHTIEWDAEREVVTNDAHAMSLLPYRRPYRKPWSLPNVKI
ncbi:MAG TPA: Gfo/Idh/MocA family oxidoreductase [Armatimonadota bacterium]|jgi:predicted dehydrogenase